MVGNVFLLISVALQDRVESIITNDLSETFKSNRFYLIEFVGWCYFEGNSFKFINWNINILRILLIMSFIFSSSGEKRFGLWCGFNNWFSWSSFNGFNFSFWCCGFSFLWCSLNLGHYHFFSWSWWCLSFLLGGLMMFMMVMLLMLLMVMLLGFLML